MIIFSCYPDMQMGFESLFWYLDQWIVVSSLALTPPVWPIRSLEWSAPSETSCCSETLQTHHVSVHQSTYFTRRKTTYLKMYICELWILWTFLTLCFLHQSDGNQRESFQKVLLSFNLTKPSSCSSATSEFVHSWMKNTFEEKILSWFRFVYDP